jgi:hypothetical protein
MDTREYLDLQSIKTLKVMQIKYNSLKERNLFNNYLKLDRLHMTDREIRIKLNIHQATLERLRSLYYQLQQNIKDSKYGEPNTESQKTKTNTIVKLPKQNQSFTFHSNTCLDYIFKN